MRLHPFMSVSLLLIACAGCGSGGERTEPERGAGTQGLEASAEKSRSARTYALRGEVVGIDREMGDVQIRHEEVPGLMPAMTMPFDLKGNPALEDLRVGDRIEARLVIDADRSRLEDLTVVEMADPLESARAEGLTDFGKPVLLEPGEIVPDFNMTTQDDTVIRLSDLRGHVVVLTFIYTRCPFPDYCPLMDRKFADLARRVRLLGSQGDATRLLSISFDPEHDTSEVLRKHAKLVGAAPPLWSFAVASHEELRKIAAPLGLSYSPVSGEIMHSLSTAVISKQGRLVLLERGNTWKVEDVFKTVRQSLSVE